MRVRLGIAASTIGAFALLPGTSGAVLGGQLDPTHPFGGQL